jgi:hypothetical protein
LPVLAVPVEQEWPARALGLESRLDLGDELGVGRSVHATILRPLGARLARSQTRGRAGESLGRGVGFRNGWPESSCG